ncbi:hypothetical protein GGR51DRAFT_578655 [Nemania sp. FL0031]|nr:hypothetical protein GGR51DRAFT_578655 [Nemania sp. FL0031]
MSQGHKAQGKAGEHYGNSNITHALLAVWYLEILSSLLALACLAIIVTIIAAHQDKPLPEWPQLITINGLISVFGAIFKASLVMPVSEMTGQLKWSWFLKCPRPLLDIVRFDDATRGPWGSLLLLTRQLKRGERAYLASLGALLTLCSLAIDPFLQSLLVYEACSRDIPGMARIPRTNNYTADGVNMSYRIKIYPQIDGVMEAALYQSLINPMSISSLIQFDCQTGNCTFEAEKGKDYFSSLAMCYSCDDITHEVVNINNDTDGEFRYVLPSGLTVAQLGIFDISINNETDQALAERSFLNFEVLTIRENPSALNNILRERYKPVAARCQLNLCTQSYSADISNGKYNEQVVSQSKLQLGLLNISNTHGFVPPAERKWFSYVADTAIINGQREACTPTTTMSDSHCVGVSHSQLANLPGSGANTTVATQFYTPACVFAADEYSMEPIRQSLINALTSQTVSASYGNLAGSLQPDGPLWLLRMFANWQANFTSINSVVQNIADSITAGMRNNPYRVPEAEPQDINLLHAYGKTRVSQTCVRVRWQIVAYPAGLLLVQTMFLIVTLWQEARSRNRWCADWKSSPLPLLFQRFEHDGPEDNDMDFSNHSMYSAAGKMTVQFYPAEI